MVTRRAALAIAALSALAIAATLGSASAYGRGRKDGFWLLARAAGISGTQIHSAFEGDSNLQKDGANSQAAREALIACMVSGGSCSAQISTYASAAQTLTQERLTVWQSLLQKAPNIKQAATVLGQLRQLRAERQQVFKQIFSSAAGDSPQQR